MPDEILELLKKCIYPHSRTTSLTVSLPDLPRSGASTLFSWPFHKKNCLQNPHPMPDPPPPPLGLTLIGALYFCWLSLTLSFGHVSSSETHGQIAEARGSLTGPKKMATKKSIVGLFFVAIFFCPFRLPLASAICPWVSEDGHV